MATLAQMIIDMLPRIDWLDLKDRRHEYAAWRLAEEALTPSLNGNDQRTAVELKAKRYVFEDNVTQVACDLQQSGRVSTEMVLKTARCLSPRVWVEWVYADPDNKRKIKNGAIIVRHDKKMIMTIWSFVHETSRIGPVAIVRMDPIPLVEISDASFELVWVAGHDIEDRDTKHNVGVFVLEFIYSLFLLSVPRASECHEEHYGRGIQKKRREQKKAPLVSFNRVVIRVGKGPKKSAGKSQSGESGGKRRFHRVDPFFRVTTKGSKAKEGPRVEYIDEHTRGDPELGISVSEKHIRR